MVIKSFCRDFRSSSMDIISFPGYFIHSFLDWIVATLFSYESQFRILSRLCCLIYYVISISYRLSFQTSFSLSNQYVFFIIADYLIDLFLIADGMQHCLRKYSSSRHTAKIDVERHDWLPRNSLTDIVDIRRKKLARMLSIRMLRKKPDENSSVKGHFLLLALNILLLLPYEVVILDSDGSYISWIRFIKLYHIIFFPIYWRDFARECLVKRGYLQSNEAQRTLLLTLLMALVSHTAACLFYGIGLYESSTGNPDSWLISAGLIHYNETIGGAKIIGSSSEHYLNSMYFSMQTLATVGYGDISATTFQETCFCISYAFISAFFMYLVTSNFELLITNHNSAELLHLAKVARFEKYSKFRRLSIDVVDRVKEYYRHQWHSLNGIDEQSLIASIPTNLYNQQRQDMFRHYLLHVKEFQSLGPQIINALSLQCEMISSSPGRILIGKNTTVTGIYIVFSGQIEIFSDDVQNSEILKSGKYFGAASVGGPFISGNELKSKTFSELIFLSSEVCNLLCQSTLSDDRYRKFLDRFQTKSPDNFSIETAGNVDDTSTTTSDRLQWQHPDSNARIAWDFLISSIVIFFYPLAVPFVLYGSVKENFYSEFKILIVASYISDLLLIFNTIANMYIFYYIEEGIVIKDPLHRLSRYLSNENVTVLLFSLLPLDAFVAAAIGSWSIIGVLRLLKLLHLSKYGMYTQRLKMGLFVFGVVLSFEVLRCFELVFFIFLVCHFVACLWLLVGDASVNILNMSTNWKEAELTNPELSIDNGFLFGANPYLRSIYWSMSTLSSIGYSDILSRNVVERGFLIAVMFFGCQLLSGLDAALASLISSLGRDKREFRIRVSKTKRLMNYYRINKALSSRVVQYLDYTWARYAGIDESAVLDSLPSNLRGIVRYSFLEPIVKKIPFFSECDSGLLEVILSMLTSRGYIDGDLVVKQGEYGDEFFIIETGLIEVTNIDRTKRHTYLSSGTFLGESSLLSNIPTKRSSSAYAVGYCDLFVLSQSNFAMIGEIYPQQMSNIIQSIRKIHSKNVQDIIDANKTKEITHRASNPPMLRLFSLLSRRGLQVGDEPAVVDDNLRGNVNGGSGAEFQMRGLWNSFLFVGLLYYVFTIPLRIVLTTPTNIFILDFAVDFLFLINSYLSCRVFAVFNLGNLVTESAKIRQLYFKSNSFIVDVVAGIPYDAIVYAFLKAPSLTLVRVKTLLRMPKLARLYYFVMLAEESELVLLSHNVSQFVTRYAALVGIITIVGVYSACGYYSLLFLYEDRVCSSSGEFTEGYSAEGLLADNMNCIYKGTWLQNQVQYLRISPDGGTEFDRFVLALNWAIPTLTKETLADVPPVNEKESLYVSIIQIFGLGISGAILGAAISMLSDKNAESFSLLAKKDFIESRFGSSLSSLPTNLIDNAIGYLDFLISEEGQILKQQTNILATLPYSIQRSLTERSFFRCLKQSILFKDFPDDALKRIGTRMTLAIYHYGDKILTLGEFGSEVYFLAQGSACIYNDSGECQIIHADSESSTFGGSGLFSDAARMATIVARSQICVCYLISRELIDEELSASDLDDIGIEELFEKLKANHELMTAALGQTSATGQVNNEQNVDPGLPVLGNGDAISPVRSSATQKRFPLNHPQSLFRVVWNILSLSFLVYYTYVIPAVLSFSFGHGLQEYFKSFAFDVLVDIFWIVDIVLRAFYFAVALNKHNQVLSSDRDTIWSNYLQSGNIYIDIAASIPLEIFALIPHLPLISVYILRCNHLLRILRTFQYTDLVEDHVFYYSGGWRPRRSLFMLVKIAYVYITVVHWLACIYFLIHRFVEPSAERTFIVMDGLASYDHDKDRHSICDVSILQCYTRTLYFVISTVSSIGYGDIMPYGNIEIIWEIILAIIASFTAALFGAYCSAYLKDISTRGDSLYRQKIKDVTRYLQFRSVSKNLETAILSQFTYLWESKRFLGDNDSDLFCDLSESLRLDLHEAMNISVMKPLKFVFKDISLVVQRRFAAIMKPQIAVEDGVIYDINDVGTNLFVVSSGHVRVTLADDPGLSSDDIAEYDQLDVCRMLLSRKHELRGSRYSPGDHFGEFSLLTPEGFRTERVVALETSIVYGVEEQDLWQIMQLMSYSTRRKLLVGFMTTIGGKVHTSLSQEYLLQSDHPSDANLSSINDFARQLYSEIIDNSSDLAQGGSNGRNSKLRQSLMDIHQNFRRRSVGLMRLSFVTMMNENRSTKFSPQGTSKVILSASRKRSFTSMSSKANRESCINQMTIQEDDEIIDDKTTKSSANTFSDEISPPTAVQKTNHLSADWQLENVEQF